jgi:hypothetical protein
MKFSELLTIFIELRLIYSEFYTKRREFCNVEITTDICPLLKVNVVLSHG